MLASRLAFSRICSEALFTRTSSLGEETFVPYWPGCLVRVEVKGLAKDPGPHALPVRGVMAGSSPRQYTFLFSRCSFREKRSLILFLNLSRAGKATSGGPII